MPLALITDSAADHLPALLNEISERANRNELSRSEADQILTNAYILLGLRYNKTVVNNLFAGVSTMEVSSTFLDILERGAVKGQQQTLIDQLQERFGIVSPELEARIKSVKDEPKLRAALRQILHIQLPDELKL